jgi:hypothetical protein
MKTLLISGGETPIPEALRTVITRGSTSVEQRRAADLSTGSPMPDADRIVFWSTGSEPGLRQLVSEYAKAEHVEHREAIVYVTTKPGDSVAGLSNTEVFVWPQDQDRLTMAFLTGA